MSRASKPMDQWRANCSSWILLFQQQRGKNDQLWFFYYGPTIFTYIQTPLLNIAYLNSNEVSTSIIWSHDGFFFSNPSLFILNITEELLNGQWLHKTMLSPLERLHESIEPLVEVGCLGHNGVGIKVTCFAELISCDPNAIDTIWSHTKKEIENQFQLHLSIFQFLSTYLDVRFYQPPLRHAFWEHSVRRSSPAKRQ